MRDETLSDKIWSSVLIFFQVLAVILSLIPMYPMKSDGEYILCSLLSPPAKNLLTNVCPVVLIVTAYTLILAICYFRSQALGTIRAIFIFSIVALFAAGLMLLPKDVMKPWPFVWHAILWAVMAVISFIRMTLEAKRFDFD